MSAAKPARVRLRRARSLNEHLPQSEFNVAVSPAKVRHLRARRKFMIWPFSVYRYTLVNDGLSCRFGPRVEDAMGTILIRCPTTNELIPVGIDTDIDTFKSLPNVEAKPVLCPLCGQEHAWSKADAVLETTGRAASRK